MGPDDTWENVKLRNVKRLVQEYPQFVPEKLGDLEVLRLQTIPDSLRARKESNGGHVFLEKGELVSLVEWKLKHGTFRPNLMKLVSSNAEDAIKSSTADAFSACDAGDITKALAAVTKLSGIGPATASLILSVYDAQNVPFFSDELFRYIHVDVDKTGEVRGWDKNIGYTKKEYDVLRERAGRMMKRLNMNNNDVEESVTALDLEKAAYVLGRSEVRGDGVAQKSTAKRQRGAQATDNRNEDRNEDTNLGDEADLAQRYPSRKKGRLAR